MRFLGSLGIISIILGLVASETIIVDNGDGTALDDSTCGIDANPPCLTISHALETRANDGKSFSFSHTLNNAS